MIEKERITENCVEILPRAIKGMPNRDQSLTGTTFAMGWPYDKDDTKWTIALLGHLVSMVHVSEICHDL